MSDVFAVIQSECGSCHNPDKCRGLWVMGRSVFEHVTQEFLHGSVSDGAVEEQQLYPL